jgi:fructosamine-3-kinase
MDLAFTKMFGGFSDDFYRGYEEISPPEDGFSDRVQIYNLYPLLVHVNLFGGHYISSLRNFLRQF